jgi:hypothetical protein
MFGIFEFLIYVLLGFFYLFTTGRVPFGSA